MTPTGSAIFGATRPSRSGWAAVGSRDCVGSRGHRRTRPIARESLAAKYQGWGPGARMSGWARESLPIAIDVRPEAPDQA